MNFVINDRASTAELDAMEGVLDVKGRMELRVFFAAFKEESCVGPLDAAQMGPSPVVSIGEGLMCTG